MRHSLLSGLLALSVLGGIACSDSTSDFSSAVNPVAAQSVSGGTGAAPPPLVGRGAFNKWTAKAPYHDNFSPFSHNVGICYGHFSGRTGSTVQADMDQLTKTDGFKMLHIYNLFKGDQSLDPDMKAVLDYAAAQSPKIEILLGTLNSEVTGELQTSAGAQAFVARLTPFLNTGVIKVIALGNELNDKRNANVPAAIFATAAQNLRTALDGAGFNSMPISTCLIFGGLVSYPPASAVFQDDGIAYSMQGYITALNSLSSKPFVFVNLQPSFAVQDVTTQQPALKSWYPDFGLFQSTVDPATHDGNLAPYWDLADLQFNCVRTAMLNAQLDHVQIYLSETGWSSAGNGPYTTPANEAAYVNNLLNLWVKPQIDASGTSVPTFLFEAYDEPGQPSVNAAYGLRDATGQLKPGIVLPSFISQ